MTDAWARWRLPTLLAAGSVALIALVVLLFGRGGGDVSTMSSASASATAGALSPAREPEMPSAAIAARPSVAPTAATTSVAAPSTQPSSAWPDPPKKTEIAATWDPNFGNPFAADAGKGSVRELMQVGAFRIGVTRDANLKDEKAARAVLHDLGEELDRVDRGRTDSYERRVTEYAPLMEKYREKLQNVMDGSFAVQGNGWTETVPITEPSAPRGAPSAH